MLGKALLQQGKWAEAKAACRKVIALKPDFALAHYNLGFALANQGKHAAAEAAYRKAIALNPDHAPTHTNLGNALFNQGKWVGAEAAHRKAIALKPGFAEAHNNLGNTLNRQGKRAEAEVAYRQAIALKPDYPLAHSNLGNALRDQGKYVEAEAACRQAIALKPDFALAHYNLGLALGKQEKHSAAEAAYRKAIALQPNYAEAHCNLGDVLQRQGRFADALSARKRGHELGSARPGWPYPSAKWVREARRLVALDARLPQFLSGQAQPAGAGESMALAQMCQMHKKQYAAAARFFAGAFAAQPTLADDLGAGHRYNAACAAALAGCGAGKDAADLAEKERARLRRQALDWLRADLNAWRRVLAKGPAKARPVIIQQMQHWLKDTDFAGARGPKALAKWSEGERSAWHNLWAQVADTLARARETAPTKEQSTKEALRPQPQTEIDRQR
jgi:Flp pilus assembly protein TadD